MLWRQRIASGIDPLEVLRSLRGQPRLVAFLGAWHQGEALISFDPDHELDSFDEVQLPTISGDGFGGGNLGLWGYQLGAQIESLPEPGERPVPQPDLRVGFYRQVLRRTNGTWFIEALGDPDPAWVRTAQAALTSSSNESPAGYQLGEFEMTPSPAEHQAAVSRVLEHISAGDIFQANLCARLEASFVGDPLDVFCQGVEQLRPAYAAFLSHPSGSVVSFSPELFLRRTGDEVLTSPIKGTASLDRDSAELVVSAKNRAENIMIVDLMRNDLGRVCQPGSVRVPALTRLEKHAVWHLVSDVVGHLEAGITDADLLRATFPPGSITGAPKVRAMQIIADLEQTAREAYTGSMGYISPVAGLELNVVIRTFEFAEGRVWLGVGGGIVADSDPADEYAEVLVKARPLIEAIGGTLPYEAPRTEAKTSAAGGAPETQSAVDRTAGVFDTLLVIDGKPIDLDAHLARLDASVRAVFGTTIRAGLEAAVWRRAERLRGRHRLRIDAVPEPVRGTAAGAAAHPVRVRLSSAPLDDAAPIWRLEPRLVSGGQGEHKWVDRRLLSTESLADPAAEPLLIDADGSVLETARASLFVVHDDGIHTPALDGRILPGTTRSRIIELAAAADLPVFQRRLTTADLGKATEVFATNVLRGVVPVVGCAGVGSWPVGPTTLRLQDVMSRWQSGEAEPTGKSSMSFARHSGSAGRKLLFVDNYDSFVYNLVQYVRELGAEAEVVRNDEVELAQLEQTEFSHVIISPGPGSPADAGISAELVRNWGSHTPILGVCLGHQVIGEVFGGTVTRAPEVVHGKPSLVHHSGVGVFAGLPTPLTFARYHSLIVTAVPDELAVTAQTGSGVVMGLRHRDHPIEGVQMHPESILTSHGHELLANFLA